MNTDVTSARPATTANPSRLECDLVMKGGITSGVIYPRLVAKLSKTYNFRSIGGTSAGAIAAGAAAAAQLGVLSGARPDAFEELDRLPNLLGGPAAGAKGSMLLNLFQPQQPFRRHFGLLTAALNAPSTANLIARIIMGAVWRFPVGAILGAAIGVAVIVTSSGVGKWLGALLAAIGLVVGALISVVVTSRSQEVRGFCNYGSTHGAQFPSLVSRLCRAFTDCPFCFGCCLSSASRNHTVSEASRSNCCAVSTSRN